MSTGSTSQGPELRLTGAGGRSRLPRPEGRDAARARAPKAAARTPTSQWEARVESSRESSHSRAGLHAQGGVLAAAIFSPPGRSRSRFPGPPPHCPRRSQRGSRSPGREGRSASRGTGLTALPFPWARLVPSLTEGGAVASPPPALTGSGLTQRVGGGAARGAVAGPIAVGSGGCARRRPGLLPFLSRARWGRRRAQVRAARGAARPGTARRGGGREKGTGRSGPRPGWWSRRCSPLGDAA